MNFKEIYDLIGGAGVMLILVGIAALLHYHLECNLSAGGVLRRFKKSKIGKDRSSSPGTS